LFNAFVEQGVIRRFAEFHTGSIKGATIKSVDHLAFPIDDKEIFINYRPEYQRLGNFANAAVILEWLRLDQ
jgi:hypothetical protein